MIVSWSCERGDDTGEPMAVLDARHDLGGDLCEIARRRRVPGRRLTLGAHRAAGDGVHAGQRQEAIGDVEDRFGNAVADRQVGDRAVGAKVGEDVFPPLLAGGSGRLGDVADHRDRAAR